VLTSHWGAISYLRVSVTSLCHSLTALHPLLTRVVFLMSCIWILIVCFIEVPGIMFLVIVVLVWRIEFIGRVTAADRVVARYQLQQNIDVRWILGNGEFLSVVQHLYSSGDLGWATLVIPQFAENSRISFKGVFVRVTEHIWVPRHLVGIRDVRICKLILFEFTLIISSPFLKHRVVDCLRVRTHCFVDHRQLASLVEIVVRSVVMT